MSENGIVLRVIQSFPFEFYGQVFTANLASDRQFYLRLDHLCEAIGLSYSSQRRRISDDEGISHRLVDIEMDTPYQDTVRSRKVTCLNIRALPYWLGTVDASRVNDDLRARIILFKRDFAETAYMVYKSDFLPPELSAEIDRYATPQERELNELMSQFRELKKKMDILSGKTNEELSRLGLTVQNLDYRFSTLEAKIIPELAVNSQEAYQISEMIKAVGAAIADTGKYPKSQSFAIAQNDFKNKFGVHIYSALPASKMQEAVDYLSARWKSLKPGQTLPDIFRGGFQESLL